MHKMTAIPDWSHHPNKRVGDDGGMDRLWWLGDADNTERR
jgi:hypothetical protein